MYVPHSLSLISLLKGQPLNRFIFQLWCLSFTFSDITLESSTTQPFHLQTQICLCLSLSLSLISLVKAKPLNHFIFQLWCLSFTLSDITLESSTTQPLHLPNVVYLLSSLTSFMKAQPFNHFISQMWSISFTDSDIIYESSTTQPFNIPNLMSLPHSLCFCA